MFLHQPREGSFKSVLAEAEITEFTGVQLCQPVLTTPGPSACLCVFDVDRTLTGKQGLAEGSQCPANRLVEGVWDSAYGGGTLTLSEGGQNLNRRPALQTVVIWWIWVDGLHHPYGHPEQYRV